MDDSGSSSDEGSVTRCICGKKDYNGIFMIQCEKCQVWQHGSCMGVKEKDVPDKYYCERCLPGHEIHVRNRSLAAANQSKVNLGEKRKKDSNSESSDEEMKPKKKRKDTPATLSREERKLQQLAEMFRKMEEKEQKKKSAEKEKMAAIEEDNAREISDSPRGRSGKTGKEIADDDARVNRAKQRAKLASTTKEKKRSRQRGRAKSKKDKEDEDNEDLPPPSLYHRRLVQPLSPTYFGTKKWLVRMHNQDKLESSCDEPGLRGFRAHISACKGLPMPKLVARSFVAEQNALKRAPDGFLFVEAKKKQAEKSGKKSGDGQSLGGDGKAQARGGEAKPASAQVLPRSKVETGQDTIATSSTFATNLPGGADVTGTKGVDVTGKAANTSSSEPVQAESSVKTEKQDADQQSTAPTLPASHSAPSAGSEAASLDATSQAGARVQDGHVLAAPAAAPVAAPAAVVPAAVAIAATTTPTTAAAAAAATTTTTTTSTTTTTTTTTTTAAAAEAAAAAAAEAAAAVDGSSNSNSSAASAILSQSQQLLQQQGQEAGVEQ